MTWWGGCERAKHGRLLAALLAAWAGSSLLRAQTPASTVEIHPHPLTALRSFEPPAGEAYQLGRGDEIALDFPGRVELSGKRVLGPDGRITLPLAGSILLADLTREQAAAAIEKALAPFYTNLSVTVEVEKYTSNRVLLLGAVEHPGILTFDTPPTLLEVISRGGALPSFASQQGQQKMPAVPERCAIYRGSDQVMWVDLKGLLDSGDALADLRLRRDDVVYVPSIQDRYVSVLGQVQHPGALQLESNSTLAKLIAQAGGLTDGAGRFPEIRVISPSSGSTRVISFKRVLQPGPLDLVLKPGDIVYVPQSGFNRVSYMMEKLSPLVSLFTAFAFLEQ